MKIKIVIYSLIISLLPMSTYAQNQSLVMDALFEEISSHTKFKIQYVEQKEDNLDKTEPAKESKSKSKSKSKGEEYVEKALAENKQKVKEYQEKQTTSMKPDSFKKNPNQTYSEWRKQITTTYNKWRTAQKEFLKNLPKIKENLIPINDMPEIKNEKPIDETIAKKEISSNTLNEISANYNLVPKSFEIPVQNQGFRPTCSSFAGVRAMEILLAKLGNYQKLSEQYFYWASKKDCRDQKCSSPGSWVREGFGYGPVPLWKDCPYVLIPKGGNETQIPLPLGCQKGFAKANTYTTLSSLDEMTIALEKGEPIIVGFKLTPNFYVNKGLVTLTASSKDKSKMDSHALGHTVLLTGVIKLPADLQEKEGKVCFITANSWGEGWGKGGYSCLTENWVKENRIAPATMVLKSIDIL